MDILDEEKENFRRKKKEEIESIELKSATSKIILKDHQMCFIIVWTMKKKGSVNLKISANKLKNK